MNDFQPLANHLWQSTLFAALAGLLTLVFKHNRAHTRYGLWLAASAKFLIPFSLLVQAGAYFERPSAAAAIAPHPLVDVFAQVSQPFAPSPATTTVFVPHPSTSFLPAVLLAAWAIGFLSLLTSWCLRWTRVRTAIRAATPLDLSIPLQAISSPAFFEPAVFGLFRAVLVLPDGVTSRLTPQQFQAILTHELCHVRRRDNLATVFHMAVEAIFWFHPLVWWLGARLMEERERACDEEVLRAGNDPEIYAEGILKICELYLATPLPCLAGVTGANLKQRIEDIMTSRPVVKLNTARKVLLVTAGVLTVVGPIYLGTIGVPQLLAQTQTGKGPTFETASVKPHASGDNRMGLPQFMPSGRFRSSAPMNFLISAAFHVPFNRNARLKIIGDVPDGVYDVEATSVIPPGLSDQARDDTMRRMLQALLADRFKMVFHRETKEIPVYALVAAKGGPKLQKAEIQEKDCPAEDSTTSPGITPVTCHVFNGGQGRGLHARAANIADLVGFVENWTDRPLVDKTGIKGLYRFDTKGWLPMAVGPPPAAGTKAEDGSDVADVPTIFQMFEGLGLKLEPAKSRVDIYVVDHIEKPTEN